MKKGLFPWNKRAVNLTQWKRLTGPEVASSIAGKWAKSIYQLLDLILIRQNRSRNIETLLLK
jgi:hypothetical protein